MTREKVCDFINELTLCYNRVMLPANSYDFYPCWVWSGNEEYRDKVGVKSTESLFEEFLERGTLGYDKNL